MASFENNPWFWSISSRLGERSAVREFVSAARSYGRDEVTTADICPRCGQQTAWIRPMVNATCCTNDGCGAVRRIDGSWTESKADFVGPMAKV